MRRLFEEQTRVIKRLEDENEGLARRVRDLEAQLKSTLAVSNVTWRCVAR